MAAGTAANEKHGLEGGRRMADGDGKGAAGGGAPSGRAGRAGSGYGAAETVRCRVADTIRRRVAILGAGVGAEHLRGYRALPERFEVVTICDRDAERARVLASAAPGAAAAFSVEAVLSDPEVDVVDVCLPPHLHARTVLDALAAGKHVVCEKPLALSLADVDRIAHAARITGGRVAPVFQYRFGIGTARLRALMEAGVAGRALAASLETHWNRDAGYYAAAPWRGARAGEGGGAVLGHAIHLHDLLIAFLGPAARVAAMTATRVNPVEVEDCAAIALEMESGAVAASSVTLGAADDVSRLRLVFEGLTAESGRSPYTPAADPWTFTARAPAAQDDVDAVLAETPVPRAGFAGFFEALADALDGRPNAAVTLADGRRSIELAAAIYHAAATGRTVRLPLADDHPSYRGWAPGPPPVSSGADEDGSRVTRHAAGSEGEAASPVRRNQNE